ncbi:MAG: protein kinase [Caldilineaceae bacterium SB0666_bin_21]|nr:protein kinase [Caldilineaceae bacterium SB0666_bin_21]
MPAWKSRVPVQSFVGQRIGRFHISRQIGSGGASTVYQAYDAVNARSVALKVMLPSSDETVQQRFRQEIQIASRLSHPNIVQTYQVGEFTEFNAGYLAMELVYGETLESLVRRVGQLNFSEVCVLLAPIARALDYAHREHLVHRDVKPSNILMRPSTLYDEHHIQIASLDYPFVPLLTDFGIASAVDMPELTATGRTVGSPSYMSPEQCSGAAPVDRRADVYALASVLYRCVVGKTLFGGTTSEVLYSQVNVEFDPENVDLQQVTLPGELLELLTKCLAKEPRHRIQTAAEMADQLTEIGASTDIGPFDLAEDREDAETQTMPHLATSPQLAVAPGAQSLLRRVWSRTSGPLTSPWSPALGLVLALAVIVLLVTAIPLGRGGTNSTGTAPAEMETPSQMDTDRTNEDDATRNQSATPELPKPPAVPLLPQNTPTGTAEPMAVVQAQEGINVRSGPGIEYPVVSKQRFDTVLRLTGHDATKSWWEVDLSQLTGQAGTRGWVSGSFVRTQDTDLLEPVSVVSPVPEPTATATPVPTATPTHTATPTATVTPTPTPLSWRDACTNFEVHEAFRELFDEFEAHLEFGCPSQVSKSLPKINIQEFTWGILLYAVNTNRVYVATVQDEDADRRPDVEGASVAFFNYPAWDFVFVSPRQMLPPDIGDDQAAGVESNQDQFFEPFLDLMYERTGNRIISLRDRLGPPLEPSRVIVGNLQECERGFMILLLDEQAGDVIVQLLKLKRETFQ